MKQILLLLFVWAPVALGFTSPAFAKIYIDVTQVSDRSFPIALVPPVRDGGDTLERDPGEQFADTVRKDLELMSIFRFIDPKAFLDDPKKKAYRETDINFANWAVLDALALVKGWYRVKGDRFTLEAFLFDVLLQKEILSKRYEAPLSQLPAAAHKFANKIVEMLTGEPGLFETKIAFVGERGKVREIYAMDFNGAGLRKLTRHESIALSPNWSKDGRALYYTAFQKDKSPQLFTYDFRTDTIRRKTNFSGMVIGLRLDPAHDLLATTLTKDGNAEIYLLNLDGGVEKRLTRNLDIDVSPTFSPDGKEIAFVSNRNTSAQIFKMTRDGDNATRLTIKQGGNNTSPAWSPKGDKIAFAGMDTDGHFDIFTMNTDGSGMVRLTYDTKNNIDPGWAPDGQMLVFASDRGGADQIFIMRPDGSHQTQVTQEPYAHKMPVWGPKPK